MGENFAIFLEGKWKEFIHCLPWVYSGTSLHTWQFNVVWPGFDSNSASIASQVYGLEHNV